MSDRTGLESIKPRRHSGIIGCKHRLRLQHARSRGTFREVKVRVHVFVDSLPCC